MRMLFFLSAFFLSSPASAVWYNATTPVKSCQISIGKISQTVTGREFDFETTTGFSFTGGLETPVASYAWQLLVSESEEGTQAELVIKKGSETVAYVLTSMNEGIDSEKWKLSLATQLSSRTLEKGRLVRMNCSTKRM